MKFKIWNVDKKPYRMELNLPETSTKYPHLRITHRYTTGTMAQITVKPGPKLDLHLVEEYLTLKRLIGKKEEILLMREGEKSQGKGVFKRLFSREKTNGGVKIQATREGTRDFLETSLKENKEFRLYLDYHATSLLCFSLERGPVVGVFLMNGNLWLADEENKEICIMSTERPFNVDRNRFKYYDTPF